MDTKPYYTSTPLCKPFREDHPMRYALYAVFDSAHALVGVYCLECARRKVDALREIHDAKEKHTL